jgi:hypothetical protein
MSLASSSSRTSLLRSLDRFASDTARGKAGNAAQRAQTAKDIDYKYWLKRFDDPDKEKQGAPISEKQMGNAYAHFMRKHKAPAPETDLTREQDREEARDWLDEEQGDSQLLGRARTEGRFTGMGSPIGLDARRRVGTDSGEHRRLARRARKEGYAGEAERQYTLSNEAKLGRSSTGTVATRDAEEKGAAERSRQGLRFLEEFERRLNNRPTARARN